MATGIRSNGYTEYPTNPQNSVGKQLKTVYYEKTIATGAGTNTLHILAGPLTLDETIREVTGVIPALNSANNNDLGFWKINADGTFTAIVQGALWSGIDLSAALTYRDLLSDRNSSLDRDDNIGTLCSLGSDQMPIDGVYLGLYIKTASTATSEVLRLKIVIEEGNF